MIFENAKIIISKNISNTFFKTFFRITVNYFLLKILNQKLCNFLDLMIEI